MNIHSVEFAGAIGQVGQAPPASIEGLPQVAVSGRSNVGKSSLINRLLGRTRTPIARVSQTPGKTQEINFYHVRTDGGEFALVDLPGYGFARAPEAQREKWAAVIQSYLGGGHPLRGVVQLLDIRRDATSEDAEALEMLAAMGMPTLLVLTKGDKFKVTKRKAAAERIVQSLGLDPDQVITSSALSGQGFDLLNAALGSLLGMEGDSTEEESTPEAPER